MKFVIGVDLEGLACVVGQPGKTLTESADFEFAKRQAVREINAAATALFDMGATRVIVDDRHDGGINLHHEDIDTRCEFIIGRGRGQWWQAIDETFTGILMIGFHAMDNSFGVLAHSFRSKTYQWMKVNGTEVGEIQIRAAEAGEMGVPLIFLSSDDVGIAEAKKFMPWIETVETKKAMGWNMALSKHPKRAADEIYDGVKKAVVRISEMEAFTFDTPIVFQNRFKRMDAAEAAALSSKDWKVIDPFTLERTLDRIRGWQ